MKRADLPSLDLLRGFEAAARHLSFTLAAEELFLTQSAVSRQVKALEDNLGTPLFRRKHRAIALTDEGQTLYAATVAAFERISAATSAIRRHSGPRAIVVTTTPGFASLWLIPRISRFTQNHAGVDVRLSATYEMQDLERNDIDLAVRYMAKPDAGNALELFGDAIVPVCSPALAGEATRPLKTPADLGHHVLLQLDQKGGGGAPLDWELWLASVGLQGLKPLSVLYISQYDQLIQAALQGQGVALGRVPLVNQLIREGRLVKPFKRSLVLPRSFYVVENVQSASKPEVRDFAQWLVAEARREAGEDRASIRKPRLMRQR